MKTNGLIVSAIVTLCLTGCFSIESGTVEKTGDEHVLARNHGYTLFNCIPLVSGNATCDKNDKFGPVAFFRNDVTTEKVQARFMEYAAKKNKREITDLTYHNYETVFMYIPFFGIPVPIPYILCYSEIQLSGVLK